VAQPNGHYVPRIDSGVRGTFVRGPQVEPFTRSSQLPIESLEQISAVDMALSVPWLRIVPYDAETRRPKENSELLMTEMTAPRTFGQSVEGRFLERPIASIRRLSVTNEQSYGTTFFSKFKLEIVVHRPAEAFADSSVWTSLLFEGVPHLVEYGWTGRSENPLLSSGLYDDASGLVVPAKKAHLVNFYKYSFNMTTAGEMEIDLDGISSGESVLRNVLLGDVILEAVKREYTKDDVSAVERALQSAITNIPVVTLPSGKFHRLGDVFDSLVAPLVQRAATQAGYTDCRMYMGNFCHLVWRTKPDYGGEQLGDRSLGDFLLPSKELRAILGKLRDIGGQLTLMNFVGHVTNIVNGRAAWLDRTDGRDQEIPQISFAFTTFPNGGGVGLIMHAVDEKRGRLKFLPEDKFSASTLEGPAARSQIFEKLRARAVPIVRFGQANAYIKESSFNVVQDELLRSNLVERSEEELRSRTVKAIQSPKETKDQTAKRELSILLSVVEGELQMIGNFVFENFGVVWVDFPGIRQLSGPFVIKGRTDTIEPGTFTTSISILSDGTDPLNTRRRLSDPELVRQQDANRRQAVESMQKKRRTRRANAAKKPPELTSASSVNDITK
jgi:hypothetical protein